MAKLCLIEDDPIMGESLCYRFDLEGFEYDWHRSAESALAAIGREDYAVVVSDICLPDLSGEVLYAELQERGLVPPPTLFITGYGSIDQAVRLLRLGAHDYLTKPFDLDELIDKVRTLWQVDGAALTVAAAPALGVSVVMRRIEAMLPRLAGYNTTILVTGESGVGKEHVARAIHAHGSGERPFVAINCGAVTESLLEAELFGYEKGAFTGANRSRRGLFEQAHGGTLFLDEVGEMSPAMQVKVLRAIQERQIVRVGGESPIPVDLRLVCATNRDLARMVAEGDFREDLYYRINVVHLRIPPLRARKEDIIWFAQQFIDGFSQRMGNDFHLLPSAQQALLLHDWPGNLRELNHQIERACLLAAGSAIGPEMVGEAQEAAWLEEPGDLPVEEATTLKAYLGLIEQEYIAQALERHGHQIAECAAFLGISRKNLWEKMKKYGL